MPAILGSVTDVVDRIDSGSEQAERGTGERNPPGDIIVAERTGGPGGGDRARS